MFLDSEFNVLHLPQHFFESFILDAHIGNRIEKRRTTAIAPPANAKP
jgi:hypothetical protein